MRNCGSISLIMLLAGLAVGQTGCSTMNNTEKGIGLGAAGGAGVGALVGGKTGAVVGGLAGAATGGLIGNDIDRQEKKDKDRQLAAAAYDQAQSQSQPARIEEIVQMAKAGQTETVVINYIRQNQMRFVLSSTDLNYLKQNGVPDGVIAEMQRGPGPIVVPGGPPNPVVVVRDPYYVAPRPVVYVDPYYGPYGYRYRRW